MADTLKTAEEIVQLALERADAFLPRGYGGPRSSLYRRVGMRQRQLFRVASGLNEEFYGVCATCPLDGGGSADLADIAAPVPLPAMIQRVTVNNPGTGSWPVGHLVSVVTLADAAAAIPPRVTIRSDVIGQVGLDLDGVRSLTISFARLPDMLGPADVNTLVELTPPHDELLVVDLMKLLVQRAGDPAARATAQAEIAADEAMLLADFGAMVSGYAPVVSRFTKPPEGVVK